MFVRWRTARRLRKCGASTSANKTPQRNLKFMVDKNIPTSWVCRLNRSKSRSVNIWREGNAVFRRSSEEQSGFPAARGDSQRHDRFTDRQRRDRRSRVSRAKALLTQPNLTAPRKSSRQGNRSSPRRNGRRRRAVSCEQTQSRPHPRLGKHNHNEEGRRHCQGQGRKRRIKGGLLVDIGVPVFLPASQVDIRKPGDISRFIGKEIECKILKIDTENHNIVVSRRKLIEEDRQSQQGKTAYRNRSRSDSQRYRQEYRRFRRIRGSGRPRRPAAYFRPELGQDFASVGSRPARPGNRMYGHRRG